ncbi:MAG: HXXEE domain-containing protein [Cellulomonas sp.]|nr:HXXEE domain-containing protein [Cellulomonas sp.]
MTDDVTHPRAVRRALWALPLIWWAHDVEELITMSRTSARTAERLQRRLPWLPASVRDRVRLDQRQATGAIALVGAVMVGTAVVADARPDSRIARVLVEVEVVALGAHAFTHVGSALVLGTYTSGLVTAPTVALPGAVLVARRLVAEGYTTWPRLRRAGRWLPVVPVVVLAAHVGARALGGQHGGRPGGRAPVSAADA